MRRWLSASHVVSSPSPSEVARPIPVIQTSVDPGLEDFVSVMTHGLLRKADARGHRLHVSAQLGIWERYDAEGDRGVAPQFTVDPDLGFGDRIARTFVYDANIDRQQIAGSDETAHFGFLDRGQERHAFEL